MLTRPALAGRIGRLLIGDATCLASVLALLCLSGCADSTGKAAPTDSTATAEESAPRGPAIHFVDVATEVGLDTFRQVSGEADKLYLPASTGAGVALVDIDLDGDLDVFLVNGSRIGGFEPGSEPTNRLYENLGQGAAFRDVTATSGLASHGAWGQGLAIADVDGDGLPDIYVTNYGGPNALYLHRGVAEDGTVSFEEVAAQAGIDTDGWSTGAAFFDYDRDGDLDLYVANFVRYDQVLAAHEGREWITHTWKGKTVASGPMGLPADGDRLYRNDGRDGGLPAFTEVSEEMGLTAVEPSYGFQPMLGDYDGDGWLDLFVANDSRPNFLWRNLEGRAFSETALAIGVAYDRSGDSQACMGVAFEDYDGDDDLDLFVTNFADDLNTLYVGDGTGFFHDDTIAAGLVGPKTQSHLAWGTFFFDSDNDGDLDLFVANGHVYPQVDELSGPETYAQTNELFEKADGRFRDISARAGPGLALVKVSRGAAFGDLDDDGDLDIVINNLDDSPTVLRNDSRSAGSWIKVQLRGQNRNLSAIGARIRLEAAGNRHSRYVRSSDSFLSHHDPRLHFGLGDAEAVDRLSVDWPDGTSDDFGSTGVGVLVTIEKGRGIVSQEPPR